MKKLVFIVMGVSGSGKSSLGKALEENLGGKFYDGDDFHSPTNVVKMSSGIALEDEDRHTWLNSLKELAKRSYHQNQYTYIACSALKASYRVILKNSGVPMIFLFLNGDEKTIQQRLEKRAQKEGHFMSPKLLKSQFAILDTSFSDSEVITLDIDSSVFELVEKVKQELKIANTKPSKL